MNSAKSSDTLPPIPESISSKIIVRLSSLSERIFFMTNKNLDSSPPEAAILNG